MHIEEVAENNLFDAEAVYAVGFGKSFRIKELKNNQYEVEMIYQKG